MKSTPSMQPGKSNFKSESSSYQLPNITNISRNTTHHKKNFCKTNNKYGKTIDSDIDPKTRSYINSIRDLTGNIQYDQMNYQTIGNQHKRLKNILRKMNSDTIRLIDDITPNNLKKKRAKPTQQTMEVRQQETINNEKILENCQREIENLTKKVETVLHFDKGYFQGKIQQTTNQLQKISADIKQRKWDNYKRGKVIVKEENSDGETLQKLQSENQLLETKVGKLRRDAERISIEINGLIDKSEDITDQYQKAEEYFSSLVGEEIKKKTASNLNKLEKTKIKTKEVEFAEKKASLEIQRKKSAFHQSNGQFRYFQALKNIEAIMSNLRNNDEKIADFEGSVINSKQEFQKLDKALKSIRAQKLKKKHEISEFLKNSKLSQQNLQQQQQTNRSLTPNQNRKAQTRTPQQRSSHQKTNLQNRYETISEKVPELGKRNSSQSQGKLNQNENEMKIEDEVIDESLVKKEADDDGIENSN